MLTKIIKIKVSVPRGSGSRLTEAGSDSTCAPYSAKGNFLASGNILNDLAATVEEKAVIDPKIRDEIANTLNDIGYAMRQGGSYSTCAEQTAKGKFMQAGSAAFRLARFLKDQPSLEPEYLFTKK